MVVHIGDLEPGTKNLEPGTGTRNTEPGTRNLNVVLDPFRRTNTLFTIISKCDLMNSIIIIGTEPPCPRCKLLAKVVAEKVKELGVDADVKHLVYTDAESNEFAAVLGLETGTASTVAKRMNVEINHSRKLVPNFESEYNTEYEDYFFTNWSYELDEHLRIFENKAREEGILMTPSLIINGELKHSGSVPRLSQLEKWLLDLK
jgi:hypothetical protein